MVYTELTDRIGNNLFQIATGASLAHNNNSAYTVYISNFKVPEGIYLKEYIEQFKTNILRKVTFTETMPQNTIKYEQPSFRFKEIEYVNNIFLCGYYQSEKFFNDPFVRDLFSMDQATESYIRTHYRFLWDNDYISINVRRGDYLKRPLRQPICEMPYFKKAIKFFGKHKSYLIISDDIEWCKKKFTKGNFHFIENEPPIIDLYLQTLCKHNIISNSTFSWWGAWLNPNPNKIVVAPKRWFGVHLKKYDTQDLVPESWVKINNPRTFSLKIKISYYWLKDIFIRAFRKLTLPFKNL